MEKENKLETLKENLKKGKRINSSDLEELVKKEYSENLKE